MSERLRQALHQYDDVVVRGSEVFPQAASNLALAVHLELVEQRQRQLDGARTTTYAEALVVFRDLCEDTITEDTNEYVRGGVNLIADLFGIPGLPVDERMDQVLADLRKIPMFADPTQLQEHGIAPYSHNDSSEERT